MMTTLQNFSASLPKNTPELPVTKKSPVYKSNIDDTVPGEIHPEQLPPEDPTPVKQPPTKPDPDYPIPRDPPNDNPIVDEPYTNPAITEIAVHMGGDIYC